MELGTARDSLLTNDAALRRADRQGLEDRARRIAVWKRAAEQRLQRLVSSAGKHALLCLPYLFHRNDPSLPGFQAGPTPAGVMEFSLGNQARAALARYFGLRGRVPVTPAGHPVIVALMVEPGGIEARDARTPIVVHVFLSDKLASFPETLRNKVEEIEAWFASRDLPVQLRLHASLSGTGPFEQLEAFGSRDWSETDRLFSAALHLGGQLPLWWVLSPEEDGPAYAQTVERIRAEGGRVGWEYADLGSPEPADESARLGALMDRVLREKMPLPERLMALFTLERAMARKATVEPLSTLMRRALHEGSPVAAVWFEAALRLDDMRHAIHEQHGPAHLRAIERLCLVDMARSVDGASDQDDVAASLEHWGDRWGWPAASRTYAALRARSGAVEAHEAGVRIREMVARSTEALANAAVMRAREYPELVRVLARLRQWLVLSAQEPSAGAVPVLLGGLVGPTRAELTVRVAVAPGEDQWAVSRPRRVEGHNAVQWDTLYECQGVVEAVVWACQNGVIGPNTRIVDEGIKPVSQLIERVRGWHTAARSLPVGPAMWANVLETVDEFYVAQGQLRPDLDAEDDLSGGGSWDPLNYGPERRNLLHKLSHVERLAGGTCRVTSYSGTGGVLAVASRLASPLGPAAPPSLVTLNQGRSQRALGARLRELFAQVVSVRGGDRVVLFELGGRIHGTDGAGRRSSYDDAELRALLAQPGAAGRIVFEQGSQRLRVLATAVQMPRRDGWQVCYARDQHTADVFVCDQSGAVHWGQTSVHRLDGHLVQLLDVLRDSHPGARRTPESVELMRTDDGRLRAAPSSHSTLRGLRKDRTLRLEGEIEGGTLRVRQGDENLCTEPSLRAAVVATAMTLLSQQRPGSEEMPPIGATNLTRKGRAMGPVELVGLIEEFRSDLAQEMRRLLSSFRKGR